jgi:hypothetical protein
VITPRRGAITREAFGVRVDEQEGDEKSMEDETELLLSFFFLMSTEFAQGL